jgi:hypothetical protein
MLQTYSAMVTLWILRKAEKEATQISHIKADLFVMDLMALLDYDSRFLVLPTPIEDTEGWWKYALNCVERCDAVLKQATALVQTWECDIFRYVQLRSVFRLEVKRAATIPLSEQARLVDLLTWRFTQIKLNHPALFAEPPGPVQRPDFESVMGHVVVG